MSLFLVDISRHWNHVHHINVIYFNVCIIFLYLTLIKSNLKKCYFIELQTSIEGENSILHEFST